MKNYYQILEVSETATQDEIKKQYRFLSQAWHPDKFPMPDQKQKAEEKIKDLNEAYDVLGNPAKRKDYDKQMGYEKEYHHETRTQAGKADFSGQRKNSNYRDADSKNKSSPVRKKKKIHCY
jgi:curved DNA-binding protein CbpA